MGIDLNMEQVHALYDIEAWWKQSNEQVYNLSGSAGTGKAQPVDTMIPTPNGMVRLGDLNAGDTVFGRLGEVVVVDGVYDKGMLDSYEVELSDGRKTRCNDDHIWMWIDENKNIHTDTLRSIIDSDYYHENKRVYIPRSGPIHCSSLTMDEDFYEYGYNNSDTELPEKFIRANTLQKWALIQGLYDRTGLVLVVNGVYTYMIQSKNKEYLRGLQTILRSIAVDTSIASIKQQQGSTTEELAHVLLSYPNKSNYLNFFRDTDTYNKIAGLALSDPDKLFSERSLYITKITKLEEQEEMRCIHVDSEEHLYLTNDFIVTHNTTLIRYFIENIGLNLDEVAFVAYMGKAAMQMARNGLPAQTIHSLIYTYDKVVDRDEKGNILFDEKGRVKSSFKFVLRKHLPKKVRLFVLDEASMVNKEIAEDLLSYGIPLIALGDLNQLPPVFGKPYFLEKPNCILTKVMRQNEDNPIVYLAQRVLNDEGLPYGVYGNSSVIRKDELTDYALKNSNIVITFTNKLRHEINMMFRRDILGIRRLDFPSMGEKVVCRRNNWNRCLNHSIYLTNGMSGTIDYIDRETFNGKTVKIDFKPDFLNRSYKNVNLDYERLFANPGELDDRPMIETLGKDQFEFAYAITCHTSQGSQYEKVIFMDETMGNSREDQRKFEYTAITRAQQSIIIVR
jgi:exodeoxyribonuclease-5